jgi:hypothetical protein
MRTSSTVGLLAFGIVMASLTSLARAADHEDSPAARADPSADYGDVIAWMSSDAQRLQIVATVVRHATAESRFSDAAVYVFHTQSRSAYGAETTAAGVDVTCTFEGTTTQTVTCTAGGSTVSGDASDPAGITSADGKLRVFAGLRNDAFFFNSSGFNATRGAVINAAPSLSFDAAGCPALDEATSNALVTTLMSTDGGAAVDAFGNANILVLALTVDKSLVTAGGPIVSVYGSTHQPSSGCGDADANGSVSVSDGVHALLAAATLSSNCTLQTCDADGNGAVTVTDGVNLLRAAAELSATLECPAPPSGQPAAGPQIDRMGRAAINTALIGPFRDPGSGGARGEIQDTYNKAAIPGQWNDLFAHEIASNLAIYDGVDRNCGNQLLAGDTAAPGRYDALADVLADDQLYVNTASGTCQIYLGVEGNAVGITNGDCGGRTPLEDTIDVSYSVLAIGALSGVGDGVPSDADGTASLDQFPFYAPPL